MIFKSKKLNLKLVIKPAKTPRDPNAVYVQFVNGLYETNDKSIIDFIKKNYSLEVEEASKKETKDGGKNKA